LLPRDGIDQQAEFLVGEVHYEASEAGTILKWP
jgi:hypothetical protein